MKITQDTLSIAQLQIRMNNETIEDMESHIVRLELRNKELKQDIRDYEQEIQSRSVQDETTMEEQP